MMPFRKFQGQVILNPLDFACLHLEKVVTVPRDEPSNINGSIRSALGIGFLQDVLRDLHPEEPPQQLPEVLQCDAAVAQMWHIAQLLHDGLHFLEIHVELPCQQQRLAAGDVQHRQALAAKRRSVVARAPGIFTARLWARQNPPGRRPTARQGRGPRARPAGPTLRLHQAGVGVHLMSFADPMCFAAVGHGHTATRRRGRFFPAPRSCF
mmetsp:Transcript_16305/g.35901  ORF Transcript_16305/g.35901 Transcript_16305/m.35901 type:complete len:209 (-) Transcript_16305:19-645(-)